MPQIHQQTQANEIAALRRRVEQLERRSTGVDSTRANAATGTWQLWTPELFGQSSDPSYTVYVADGLYTQDSISGLVTGFGHIDIETMPTNGTGGFVISAPVEAGVDFDSFADPPMRACGVCGIGAPEGGNRLYQLLFDFAQSVFKLNDENVTSSALAPPTFEGRLWEASFMLASYYDAQIDLSFSYPGVLA